MKNPLVELPINEEDLQTVSEILAPLYKTTAEGEAKDIKAVIRSCFGTGASVETAGFIAVVAGQAIRVMIGNHLIRTGNVKVK